MGRMVIVGIILILLHASLSGCLAENQPPEASLVASATSINVNQDVIFSANGSVDKDGKIVRYFWNFGDGNNGTGKYVTYHYEKGGNYTVILIVTDNDGKKAIETITIHVNELPEPIIDISLPAYIHEEVYFWANDSYDPDGYILDYHWDLGDGTNDTGKSVSHVYTSRESFTVTLTVTDNSGAKSATSKLFDVQYRTYQVTWDEDHVVVFNSTEEYGGNYTFEEDNIFERPNKEYLTESIHKLNMTNLVFNLKWVDEIPLYLAPPIDEQVPNDVFIMNISVPTGEGYQGEPETDELISMKVPGKGKINPFPEDMDVQAESEDMVYDLIAANTTTCKGIGDWQINITLLEAGGAGGGEVDVDTGNTWFLEIVCIYYIPVVTKK